MNSRRQSFGRGSQDKFRCIPNRRVGFKIEKERDGRELIQMIHCLHPYCLPWVNHRGARDDSVASTWLKIERANIGGISPLLIFDFNDDLILIDRRFDEVRVVLRER